MYTDKDLVRVAKRENNTKRNYLVVNPLQGKHVPVSPKQAFQMFDSLAEKIRAAYGEEPLLLIGFAETATAVGARLAVCLDAYYMQTTREEIEGADYLFFSEEHSHASEQKLIRSDLEMLLQQTNHIVFVEDEVTTGNTIFHIIRILEKEYPSKLQYSVASLLNGMNREALKRFAGAGIDLHYLVKTNHDAFVQKAESYMSDGIYVPVEKAPAEPAAAYRLHSYINARRRTKGRAYAEACRSLWEQIKEKIQTGKGQNILVAGTEECMYPALFVGECLERQGNTVKCHATTRSPICVSRDGGYPLHRRYELRSMYQEDRITYMYDLEKYDRVLIVTDAAECGMTGIYSLMNALRACGNDEIQLFRWCEA